MAKLVVELDCDAADFDEALAEAMEGLTIEKALTSCWDLVGQFHTLVESYAADHRWAQPLLVQLETAADVMEASQLIQAIDDISLDLAIDAPEISTMGGKAMRALRSELLGLDGVGLQGSGLPSL